MCYESGLLPCSCGPNPIHIGDVEARKAITTWKLGSGVNHQQVGNTWTGGDDIVSLSMSGDLNIFDKRVGDKPARVLNVLVPPMLLDLSTDLECLQGPQKSITTAISAASSPGTFFAGTADGRILAYSDSGYVHLEGEGHCALVSGLAAAPDGKVYSVGFDDRVREIDGGKSFV